MKHLRYTTIILLVLVGCKKEEFDKGINQSFSIVSVNNQKTYEIKIYYPESQFSNEKVPVIFVLDGFWYHKNASELCYELSNSGKIPKCLVVSIDYKELNGVYERTKDYIYPGEGISTENRGDLFYKFLVEELYPELNLRYKIDSTQRVLFGHSLGGLFALYQMLENSPYPFFNKAIAASCSMTYGNNYLFNLEQNKSNSLSDINVKIYLGSGILVGGSHAFHQEFHNRLVSRNYPSLQIKYEKFPKSHATDVFPSLKNGLIYVLN